MSSPTGSEQNHPQGGAPQGGQPGWSTPPQQPSPGYDPPGYSPQGYNAQGYNAQSYNPPGYDPAPSYAGGAPATGQRPGGVTAAAIIAIVWGALGALFGLVVTLGAFALGVPLAGLIFLVSTVLSVALIVGGIQVLQGKSPRLLLMLCYVAIALSVISLIITLASTGGNAFSGILGIVIPGVIVFLLMQPQTKQHYASRGISY